MTTVRQRIGDAERDRATECLREHMASGRLEPAEFDDRLETALTAHFQSEIDGLFADLPAPHPQPAAQPRPNPASAAYQEARPVVEQDQQGCARSQQTAGWNVMVALMWIGAIVVCATVGWQLWWLMFIPMVLSGGLHKHRRQMAFDRHQQHRMRYLDQRRAWRR